MKAEKRSNTKSDVTKNARRLVADPAFLFRVACKIEELGVVGEERNRLILFLACVTRVLPNPTALIIRGSLGKSSLVNPVTWLFNSRHVVNILDFSEKEIASELTGLSKKILVKDDYRESKKDKQLLLKLLQPEGSLFKIIDWDKSRSSDDSFEHKMKIDSRPWPVVIFTTRHNVVVENEDSRFLSLYADESPEQTSAIVKARAQGLKLPEFDENLEVWEQATDLLVVKQGDFDNHPSWLSFVAEQLPMDKIAVRRAWERFVLFCCAIALCRGVGVEAKRMAITFPDFCVAYRIFESVFASELYGIRIEELRVARTIAKLNTREGRPATVSEVAAELRLDERLISEGVNSLQKSGLVSYKSGAWNRNEEGLVGLGHAPWSFLPSPKIVLENHRKLGAKVSYVDPFSGEMKWIEA